jgi:ribose transport system permease protein
MRSSVGVGLRGVGGNPGAMRRFGWSVIRSKAILFGCAGLLGVCSGLTLLGLATSADANIALRYTLLSVAGVILGGGEFVGGRVSALGAVLGAITLTLASSFLSFLQIAPEWQIGLQGMILIAVLSLRLVFRGRGARR